MPITLQSGTRVMFAGDSITDCRWLETDNPLGYGYPLRVAGEWGLAHSDRAPVWLNSYIELLTPLAEREVELILIEPFLLPVNEDQCRWREDLDPKIKVVRDLAVQFNAALVATDDIFAGLASTTGPEYWAGDGVHPTAAGHQAIAQAWLRTVG